ncbi:MbnP family protein [Rubritalea marina]|uniref:MbnP family protein n=1 Tax=Rubritalea marina TaxID=361055 RepID=UPI000374CC92|nr:MbnP family protein [Rubritalea marina]
MLKTILAIQLLCLQHLMAGQLSIHINHLHRNAPLMTHSLRYQTHAGETYSISRLSYLLSGFELQSKDGSWIDIPEQFAWIDHSKRRSSFTLKDVPSGQYKGLRMKLGLPKKQNHGDPAQYDANHPLNPNLNQLHWNWQGGYIFLALEGKFRNTSQHSGFVYHLANDSNLTQIRLPGAFQLKDHSALSIGFDLEKLLGSTRPISFVHDGASTHSGPGDSIASALTNNLPSCFTILGVHYPAGQAPAKKVAPLYLPETFTPYPFKTSRFFTKPALPRDNPLLVERVALGQALFHDKLLSKDHSISCSSCHQDAHALSDPRPLSAGVNGALGKRHSMPLFNLAWKSEFFWDGRATSLRQQVLMPIEDPLEMDLGIEQLVLRLEKHPHYPAQFHQAFGAEPITAETIALALENFLLSLTSYQSKFDKAMAGKATLNKLEQRGMQLFFTEYEPRNGKFGADCFHCHGGANFSDHQFHNNGLSPKGDDLGRYEVTGIESDMRKFSTPSLRQLAFTAPYMHDGRFASLEEVVQHYSGPMHQSPTLDPNLAKHPKRGLELSLDDQAALVAFLKCLSTEPSK